MYVLYCLCVVHNREFLHDIIFHSQHLLYNHTVNHSFVIIILFEVKKGIEPHKSTAQTPHSEKGKKLFVLVLNWHKSYIRLESDCSKACLA